MGLVPYLALALGQRWICDDALISFRYARHLVEGLGLRFNASEAPAVEGYSNLAWILALAPFEALGLELTGVSQVLSIACGAALIALCARLAQRRFAVSAASTIGVSCVLGCLPSTTVWATSGLETMAFALALFGVFERLDARSTRAAAACTIAATWLRADGAVWVAAVLGAAAFARSTSWATVARVALALAIAVAAQLALRRIVHGDWLPNTAHAKVGASALRTERGFAYVASFVLAEPALLVALLASTLYGLRGTARLISSLLAIFGFACAASVYVGGDFMPYGRFLVPATPFVVLAAATAWKRLEPSCALSVAFSTVLVALSIAPLIGLEPAPRALRQRFHFRWNRPDAITEHEQWRAMRERQEFWSKAAAVIARHTRPGESMVLDAVGALGYRTELELFDMYGLVSPEVARRGAPPVRASAGHDLKVEPEFFLERQPDYIGAALATSDTALDYGLPADWRTRPWAARLRIERAELEPSDGFPARTELRLFRLDWTQ